MPDRVKKAGSFFILGTYVTSIAIAVTLFGGTVLKGAYDNNKDLEFFKSQMETMNQTMAESLVYIHDISEQTNTNLLKLQYCKGRVVECRMHQDSHYVEFNIIKAELVDAQKAIILQRQRIHYIEKGLE